MAKKKLRYLIGTLCVGGAERHLSYVLPELRKRGWEIIVLTLSTQVKGDLVPYLRENGIIVKTLPKFFGLSFLPQPIGRCIRLAANFFRLSIDFLIDRESITHFFLPAAYIMGMTAAKITFLPAAKIMSRRSMNYYQQKRKLFFYLERYLHKQNDFVLGNSKGVVNQLHEEEGVPLSKLGLIYNGIETSNLQEFNNDAFRNELCVNTDTYLIVIVANLLPYKGHEDLLNALSKINPNLGDNWRLCVVGRDNGLLPKLKKLVSSLKLNDKILWLGSRNDVYNILATANLGVLCSHEEGFSNAIIESMSMGLPMVVTDVGGNSEAIIEKQCGLVVPPKSPEMLANAILWMYQNPKEAKQYGENGRQRVIEYFSIERCVDMYENLYNELNYKTYDGLTNTLAHQCIYN
jgi:glycosyltransferase involved in cell wall biosynthesis